MTVTIIVPGRAPNNRLPTSFYIYSGDPHIKAGEKGCSSGGINWMHVAIEREYHILIYVDLANAFKRDVKRMKTDVKRVHDNPSPL